MKYRVSSKNSLAALGYGAADIGSVPAPLLAALPTGADLDLAAAAGAAEPKVTAPSCDAAEEREQGEESAVPDKADTAR